MSNTTQKYDPSHINILKSIDATNPKTNSIKCSKNIEVLMKISPKNASFKNSLKAKTRFDVRTEKANGNVENIRHGMMDTQD